MGQRSRDKTQDREDHDHCEQSLGETSMHCKNY